MAAARAELAPSALDRERVRRSLGSRLAGVAVGASASAAAAAPGAVPVASGSAMVTGGNVAAAGLGKVFLTSVLWSTLGATTLVVGVETLWQGLDGGVVSTPATRAITQGALPQAAPNRAVPKQPRPSAPVATTSEPPDVRAHGAASKPLAVGDQGAPREQSNLTLAPSMSGMASAGPQPTDPLKAELELLKRARHASEAGEPRSTLATLSDLDKAYPGGALLQERAALRAIAMCQVASATARASALSEFERSYPASVYTSKVRASCSESNESQSQAPSDTHTNDAAGQTPRQ